jgi:hypothetical protein
MQPLVRIVQSQALASVQQQVQLSVVSQPAHGAVLWLVPQLAVWVAA